MDNLKIKGAPDRSKINMHEPQEVQYWTRHLNVSTEQLQRAIDKVGNAAAAVRKELGRSVLPSTATNAKASAPPAIRK
jgi:Tfp pilus assembly PilM family ATPase